MQADSVLSAAGWSAGGAGPAARSVRQDVQPFLADLVAADHADAVGPAGDAVEGRLDHPQLLQPGGAEILQHLLVLALHRPLGEALADRLLEFVLDLVEPRPELAQPRLELLPAGFDRDHSAPPRLARRQRRRDKTPQS